MALNIYTTDKTSPRCFPWLWFVRLLQIVITIIILAITASNASEFSSITCDVPSKLGYNIAAAVLSLIVLIILLLSTGPKPSLRVLPWFIWGQLALDTFMFIIWIAAAGVSQYDCNDLCNACSGFDTVWADNLYCTCYFVYKRDQSPVRRELARSVQERATRRGPALGRVAGKTALNAIIVVLFAFTTAATIFWILKNRRSGTAPSTATPLAPQPTPAPGAAPMSGPSPAKTDASYTEVTPQGSYYPPGPPQGQAPMQQTAYPQPTVNTQQPSYATSGPQGSAGDYYNQYQAQPQQAHYPPNHAEMQSPSTEQPAVSPVTGH
ncbi:MAG: hypothetical protein LQ350_004834 [Teloschistes chrysophthalmus]|nr:MAG: hypothetical protein LQ350_004834 [Niorma chrysophthalma]